ncbi:uncharacterized protein UTRI_04636 [Ustilago trichophora]|uniref:U2-associated protein SR140 n=1 Tax=Ustilago trichophora TaxID=86804 RepID=A0A5C3EE79_9BASI|nr:uncharacterized protein UTRI_04636 [Ustilago trichophora]
MSSGGSGSYPHRPYRLSRVDLGADEDNAHLDYSGQAGPSNPSRHMASRPYYDPRSSRSHHTYHDLDSPSHHQTASHRADRTKKGYPHPPRSPIQQRTTPSPEPDKDVLAYIRAQAQHSSSSNEEQRIAEQLKRQKFQHGAGTVKSRVQKEREAEERKKKQAEQDAAKAYDEFVAAMGGDVADSSDQASSNFTKKHTGFVAAGGKAYVGSRSEASPAVKPTLSKDVRQERGESGGKAPLKRVSTAFQEDEDSPDEAASIATLTRKEPQRKRHAAMSSFLSELQTEQAQRESRLSTLASTTNKSISTLLAHETLSKPGSRDLVSDPLTTNICIVSLPPHVDERAVGDFFRQWGDVATVKIMWPRGEQRERVGGLTGFVAFMTRSEAEYAFKEADGAMWGGTRVKLSWGKAMPLPSRAAYPMSREKRREERQADEESGSKSSLPKLVIRHRRTDTTKINTKEKLKQEVEREYGETQRLFIETVASRIRSNGAHFEQILREREADNPKFAFLHQEGSILFHYFRVFLDPHYTPLSSNLDDVSTFSDAGSDELYSTDSGEESENERLHLSRPFTSTSATGSTALGALSRRRLTCMLRSLTLRRERIARVTAFALDHAASYTHVVSLLTSSLLQPSTPIPRKLARLYALSDILHNSGSPISNAWRYRAALEAQLPLVFAHLGMVARSFTGRMKREEFRGKCGAVLEIWEGWIVVSPHVLDRLRRVFDCPPVLPRLKMREADEEEEDVDGEALESENVAAAARMTKSMGAKVGGEEEEDLDGEALDVDPPTDGPRPQDAIQDAIKEHVDGEPLLNPSLIGEQNMEEEEDLDGEAL